MRKLALLFLFGFVATYVPLIYFFAKVPTNVPDALAEDAEEEVIAVVLQTLEPEETKESAVLASIDESIKSEPPVPTAKSTPKPTSPAPKPTTAPTETPTPSPEPTETPIPVPTATPDVWAPADMEGWFSQYAGMYGVDKNILERLANCESHFNANATNGDYLGMFQFSTSTWQNYRAQMGLDASPSLRSNAEESIKTAAYVIQQRGTAPWPSCLR